MPTSANSVGSGRIREMNTGSVFRRCEVGGVGFGPTGAKSAESVGATDVGEFGRVGPTSRVCKKNLLNLFLNQLELLKNRSGKESRSGCSGRSATDLPDRPN